MATEKVLIWEGSKENNSVNLVHPHGGRLLTRLVIGDERNASLSEARTLPRVRLSSK